jgi:hypothetical protein
VNIFSDCYLSSGRRCASVRIFLSLDILSHCDAKRNVRFYFDLQHQQQQQ